MFECWPRRRICRNRLSHPFRNTFQKMPEDPQATAGNNTAKGLQGMTEMHVYKFQPISDIEGLQYRLTCVLCAMKIYNPPFLPLLLCPSIGLSSTSLTSGSSLVSLSSRTGKWKPKKSEVNVPLSLKFFQLHLVIILMLGYHLYNEQPYCGQEGCKPHHMTPLSPEM